MEKIVTANTEYVLFTDVSIRNLKPTDNRRIVWAKGLTGLGVRISPKGTKSFIFKYDFDGQDRWLTLGRYPKVKLADAFQKYGEAIEKVEQGEDPAEDQVQTNQIQRNALTIRQLAEEYIEKYAKTHKRSWKEDERILNYDVLNRWGGKRAAKISRRDVLALLDDIVARGSPVQANRTLAVIRRMFNFGIDRDVIQASPCYRVKPPSKEKSKDRYLTLDELGQFWNSLDSAPLAENTKLALRLLTLTLQRCSEVLGINRAELNLKDGTWLIPARRAKNKRPHLVMLSPPALEIIEEMLESASDDGFLFPGKKDSETMTVAALSRAIARNMDHFGIPKFTPHDLRRTGSTQLAAFKVPRFDRDRLLSHTDKTIGAVYDIYEYQDEKRAALNLWADIVLRSSARAGAVDVNKLQKTLQYKNYF